MPRVKNTTLPTWSVELMLAGWRKTNTSGMVVSFFVPPEDEEFFENATARKGKLAGQRYQTAFVELGDDEAPKKEAVEPLTPAEKKGKKKPAFPNGLCGLAVKWCQDPHFHKWAEGYDDHWLDRGSNDEERAKAFVCSTCDIASRKELDENEGAAQTFKNLILTPYADGRRHDGIDDDLPF